MYILNLHINQTFTSDPPIYWVFATSLSRSLTTKKTRSYVHRGVTHFSEVHTIWCSSYTSHRLLGNNGRLAGWWYRCRVPAHGQRQQVEAWGSRQKCWAVPQGASSEPWSESRRNILQHSCHITSVTGHLHLSDMTPCPSPSVSKAIHCTFTCTHSPDAYRLALHTQSANTTKVPCDVTEWVHGSVIWSFCAFI